MLIILHTICDIPVFLQEANLIPTVTGLCKSNTSKNAQISFFGPSTHDLLTKVRSEVHLKFCIWLSNNSLEQKSIFLQIFNRLTKNHEH